MKKVNDNISNNAKVSSSVNTFVPKYYLENIRNTLSTAYLMQEQSLTLAVKEIKKEKNNSKGKIYKESIIEGNSNNEETSVEKEYLPFAFKGTLSSNINSINEDLINSFTNISNINTSNNQSKLKEVFSEISFPIIYPDSVYLELGINMINKESKSNNNSNNVSNSSMNNFYYQPFLKHFFDIYKLDQYTNRSSKYFNSQFEKYNTVKNYYSFMESNFFIESDLSNPSIEVNSIISLFNIGNDGIIDISKINSIEFDQINKLFSINSFVELSEEEVADKNNIDVSSYKHLVKIKEENIVVPKIISITVREESEKEVETRVLKYIESDSNLSSYFNLSGSKNSESINYLSKGKPSKLKSNSIASPSNILGDEVESTLSMLSKPQKIIDTCSDNILFDEYTPSFFKYLGSCFQIILDNDLRDVNTGERVWEKILFNKKIDLSNENEIRELKNIKTIGFKESKSKNNKLGSLEEILNFDYSCKKTASLSNNKVTQRKTTNLSFNNNTNETSNLEKDKIMEMIEEYIRNNDSISNSTSNTDKKDKTKKGNITSNNTDIPSKSLSIPTIGVNYINKKLFKLILNNLIIKKMQEIKYNSMKIENNDNKNATNINKELVDNTNKKETRTKDKKLTIKLSSVQNKHPQAVTPTNITNKREVFVNPYDCFFVKLFFMGEYRIIPVDYYFITNKFSQWIMPITESKEIWPAILTKALISLFNSSNDFNYLASLDNYHSLNKINDLFVFYSLLGYVPFKISEEKISSSILNNILLENSYNYKKRIIIMRKKAETTQESVKLPYKTTILANNEEMIRAGKAPLKDVLAKNSNSLTDIANIRKRPTISYTSKSNSHIISSFNNNDNKNKKQYYNSERKNYFKAQIEDTIKEEVVNNSNAIIDKEMKITDTIHNFKIETDSKLSTLQNISENNHCNTPFMNNKEYNNLIESKKSKCLTISITSKDIKNANEEVGFNLKLDMNNIDSVNNEAPTLKTSPVKHQNTMNITNLNLAKISNTNSNINLNSKRHTVNDYTNLESTQRTKLSDLAKNEVKTIDEYFESNLFYSIIDYYNNSNFNLDRLKPLDFSDFYQLIQSSKLSYKTLNRKEKKAYLDFLIQLKANLKTQKEERIKMILTKGKEYNLIKIAENGLKRLHCIIKSDIQIEKEVLSQNGDINFLLDNDYYNTITEKDNSENSSYRNLVSLREKKVSINNEEASDSKIMQVNSKPTNLKESSNIKPNFVLNTNQENNSNSNSPKIKQSQLSHIEQATKNIGSISNLNDKLDSSVSPLEIMLSKLCLKNNWKIPPKQFLQTIYSDENSKERMKLSEFLSLVNYKDKDYENIKELINRKDGQWINVCVIKKIFNDYTLLFNPLFFENNFSIRKMQRNVNDIGDTNLKSSVFTFSYHNKNIIDNSNWSRVNNLLKNCIAEIKNSNDKNTYINLDLYKNVLEKGIDVIGIDKDINKKNYYDYLNIKDKLNKITQQNTDNSSSKENTESKYFSVLLALETTTNNTIFDFEVNQESCSNYNEKFSSSVNNKEFIQSLLPYSNNNRFSYFENTEKRFDRQQSIEIQVIEVDYDESNNNFTEKIVNCIVLNNPFSTQYIENLRKDKHYFLKTNGLLSSEYILNLYSDAQIRNISEKSYLTQFKSFNSIQFTFIPPLIKPGYLYATKKISIEISGILNLTDYQYLLLSKININVRNSKDYSIWINNSSCEDENDSISYSVNDLLKIPINKSETIIVITICYYNNNTEVNDTSNSNNKEIKEIDVFYKLYKKKKCQSSTIKEKKIFSQTNEENNNPNIDFENSLKIKQGIISSLKDGKSSLRESKVRNSIISKYSKHCASSDFFNINQNKIKENIKLKNNYTQDKITGETQYESLNKIKLIQNELDEFNSIKDNHLSYYHVEIKTNNNSKVSDSYNKNIEEQIVTYPTINVTDILLIEPYEISNFFVYLKHPYIFKELIFFPLNTKINLSILIELFEEKEIINSESNTVSDKKTKDPAFKAKKQTNAAGNMYFDNKVNSIKCREDNLIWYYHNTKLKSNKLNPQKSKRLVNNYNASKESSNTLNANKCLSSPYLSNDKDDINSLQYQLNNNKSVLDEIKFILQIKDPYSNIILKKEFYRHCFINNISLLFNTDNIEKSNNTNVAITNTNNKQKQNNVEKDLLTLIYGSSIIQNSNISPFTIECFFNETIIAKNLRWSIRVFSSDMVAFVENKVKEYREEMVISNWEKEEQNRRNKGNLSREAFLLDEKRKRVLEDNSSLNEDINTMRNTNYESNIEDKEPINTIKETFTNNDNLKIISHSRRKRKEYGLIDEFEKERNKVKVVEQIIPIKSKLNNLKTVSKVNEPEPHSIFKKLDINLNKRIPVREAKNRSISVFENHSKDYRVKINSSVLSQEESKSFFSSLVYKDKVATSILENDENAHKDHVLSEEEIYNKYKLSFLKQNSVCCEEKKQNVLLNNAYEILKKKKYNNFNYNLNNRSSSVTGFPNYFSNMKSVQEEVNSITSPTNNLIVSSSFAKCIRPIKVLNANNSMSNVNMSNSIIHDSANSILPKLINNSQLELRNTQSRFNIKSNINNQSLQYNNLHSQDFSTSLANNSKFNESKTKILNSLNYKKITPQTFITKRENMKETGKYISYCENIISNLKENFSRIEWDNVTSLYCELINGKKYWSESMEELRASLCRFREDHLLKEIKKLKTDKKYLEKVKQETQLCRWVFVSNDLISLLN